MMYSIDSFNYSIASDKLPFTTEILHFNKNNGDLKQFLTQFSFYCSQTYCPFNCSKLGGHLTIWGQSSVTESGMCYI